MHWIASQVSVAYGGETDKGIVDAVQVRPAVLYVVEDCGGQYDEDGYPRHCEAERIE